MAERVLSVRLRAITDAYERGMGRAADATDRFAARSDRVTSVGRSMEDLGGKMTWAAAPVAALGLVATKSAISFESAFAGVEKTVEGTTGQLAGLRQGIIDMANSIPASREEISQVAAAAGQLGIQTDAVLGFTRVMIDMGESTDLSSDQAATALAQLANITQMPQTQFSNLGSSVVALGNNMATTESKIVDMSLRIASAGKAVGLSEAEITGFAATLSSVGIEAEAGGTAMSRVLIEIASAVDEGGAKLDQFARVAGMSGQQFAEVFNRDAAGAVTAFVQGLGQVEASGGSLFGVMEQLSLGDVRVGNALRSMAGAGGLLTEALDLSTAAWGENSALTEEASKRYATAESRLRVAMNRVTDLARKTGEALVPALMSVLGLLDPVVSGLGGLADAAASAPRGLQLVGTSILGIALASGPTIWALGKLAGLYAPVVAGFSRITAGAMAMGETFAFLQSGGLSAGRALLAMLGPAAAVGAAIGVLAGAYLIAKRNSDELHASHVSAADAAMQLAQSAGVATQSLQQLNDQGVEGPAISNEQFRRANEDTLKTLREIDDVAGQQSMLMEIAYGLRLRGVDPEVVIEQVTRLANQAQIDIPVKLTTEGIDDFSFQVDAAVERAKRSLTLGDTAQEIGGILPGISTTSKAMRLELDSIARSASDAWATDNIAGFVQILAASEQALGSNSDAIDYLIDRALEMTGVQGLSTDSAASTAEALEQLASSASHATPAQQELISNLIDAATGMDGAGAAALRAAAGQDEFAFSTADYANRAAEGADATSDMEGAVDGLAGGMESGADAGGDLTTQLAAIARNASISTVEIDAASRAAEAFARSMANSSVADDRLRAGLSSGKAFRELREGMTGQQRMQEITRESADAVEEASSAIDELGSISSRTDPKLSMLGIRLGSLGAAADAFRQAMSDSSWIDDQISAALDLGTAYEDFEKSARRLPPEIDMLAISTGELSKRQREALGDLDALGQASQDYLATMLEMGRGEAEVRAEAARMRDEYAAVMRQAGLTEQQVQQYLEVLGLTPKQVDTAITLSGAEAARFQLDAYLQLLQGRIPENVASSVIASIEANDLQGAAAQLASWAKTNPVKVRIEPEADVDEVANKIADIQASLWDLPQNFDPLTAALGGYSDSQSAALDAVLSVADGAQNYLKVLVGTKAPTQEVIDQGMALREEFLAQLAQYGINGAAAEEYARMVGLTKDQIVTSVQLAGIEESVAKLQLLNDLMLNEDGTSKVPEEIRSQISVAVAEGRLADAANLMSAWVQDQQDGMIDNPLIQEMLADTEPATVATMGWFYDVLGLNPKPKVDADTDPARGQAWRLAGDIQRMSPEMSIRLKTYWDGVNWAEVRESVLDAPANRSPAPADRIPGSADGGLVTGRGGARQDLVPRMLSPGEFVVDAWATQQIGVDRLKAGNRTGVIPGTTIAVDRPMAYAGGAATDPRVIAALDQVRAAISGIERGVRIEGDITMPTTSPSRAAAALFDTIDAVAWSNGYMPEPV